MPVKHEENKLDGAAAQGPPAAAPGISADALNRLIAMGNTHGEHL